MYGIEGSLVVVPYKKCIIEHGSAQYVEMSLQKMATVFNLYNMIPSK